MRASSVSCSKHTHKHQNKTGRVISNVDNGQRKCMNLISFLFAVVVVVLLFCSGHIVSVFITFILANSEQRNTIRSHIYK